MKNPMRFITNILKQVATAAAARLRLPGLPAIALMLMLTPMPCFAAAQNPAALATPPLGERWFGIYFNGERTGFVHSSINEIADGYRIDSDSSVKMAGLGFSREASVRESYIVNRDLSLRSLDVSQIIDGSLMKLSGEVLPRSIKVTIEAAGKKKEKILKKKGPVFPPAALNLLPLFRGTRSGGALRVAMLDVEAVSVKDVNFTVVGNETLEGIKSVHMRNDLYPFVGNDIWVDASGNTLKESVRDGWIETRTENESDARKFLAEAAMSKKDMILDFSLVPADRVIEKPSNLKRLELELSGFPDNVPLVSSPVQKVERTGGNKLLVTIDNSPLKAQPASPQGELPDLKRYISATDRIMAGDPEINRRQKEILDGATKGRAAVEKLVRWVADYVKDTITDSQTPLETLEKRTGNCQSHARLYASLARAAGIPTRFVSGIVYAEGKGFLYHSWAESYVGYWLPVDPTFGEVPANVTHIKLAEGDSPDDMAPLAGVIGRIKAHILKLDY
ncbi:MAG: transglutaminase-like domain-containing protein [Geobacteraceae bacterium]|nr:transglutaminase-like domain-containing protein [Geobacteraceae bacterium]